MTTETLERRVLKAQVTSTPTDGRGTFDFEVHPFEVDSDNERIKNFTNVASGKRISVPLDYQHTLEEMDPGGTIGTASVTQKDNALSGTAKLDIASNPMAMAVYERLLLPESDPLRLSEVSIFYAFEPSKSFKGQKGETVQVDCELLGLAVVHKGAQRTAIMNVKNEKAPAPTSDAAMRAHLMSATPDGHGMATADVPPSMDAMMTQHQSMHSDGAPHTHGMADAKTVGSIGTAYVDVVPRFAGPLAEMMTVNATTDTSSGWYAVGLDKVGAKLGRALSAKNEAKLRQALDLLSQVVESVGTTSAEDAPKETAKAEEPEGAKAEEPPAESESDMVRAQWDEVLKPVRERG